MLIQKSRMSNSTVQVLSCDDTPLSIASSATGFITAFIAVVFAYYGFVGVILTASEDVRKFEQDLRLLEGETESLGEALGLSGDSERKAAPLLSFRNMPKSQAQRVRDVLDIAVRTITDAKALLNGLDVLESERFESTWTGLVPSRTGQRPQFPQRVRLGILWWWSVKAKAAELTNDFATYRVLLSWM